MKLTTNNQHFQQKQTEEEREQDEDEVLEDVTPLRVLLN